MTAAATTTRFRFVDADGHALEPPTGLQEFSPLEYRERVWHVETDGDGPAWVVADGHRSPANVFSLAGVAGYSDEDKQRALEGVYTYGEVSRRSWDAKLRIECMDDDGIDVSVLYPTQMLAIQAHRDVDYAIATC